MSTTEEPKKKSRRGFAAMNPEKQKEIAKAGGRAAHAKGTAHKFTSEEASAAGKKGGQKAAERRAEEKAREEANPSEKAQS